MKEDEAKKLVCPFQTKLVDGVAVQVNCIASPCMVWRWVHPVDPRREHGYCGAGGIRGR